MCVAANFKMTQAEILALSGQAANIDDDPYRSPVFQLRTLLGV
jgi:hypothetical protein